MTGTPITDHWWDRDNFDDDDRKVGRLVSMKGLSVVTGLPYGVVQRVTAKYEDAWHERGPHGELNDPDILRRIWLHRGIPDQEWIRIWEVEEIRRWMKESADYQELRARHGD